MFEPHLPENRAAFDRYSRLMRRAVWVAPLAWLVFTILLLVALRGFAVDAEIINRFHIGLTVGLLIGAALFMGYCELQKTLIWRRDLRGRDAGTP